MGELTPVTSHLLCEKVNQPTPTGATEPRPWEALVKAHENAGCG